MTKQELRKKFNRWLGHYFDSKNKEKNQTHRCIFCYNSIGEEDLDCACCLNNRESKKCGCNCHYRIGQIIDFFWKYIRLDKSLEWRLKTYFLILSCKQKTKEYHEGYKNGYAKGCLDLQLNSKYIKKII